MAGFEDFYSVGIDIGTTTTQVVFSRIVLEKAGGFAAIPTIKIAKKDVVYKSEIHFTPLISHNIVDAVRLKDIIANEYKKSKIDSKDITTGAVIITGESARKENAREVVEQLAQFAGDFVVCTAGPDYEAVLAGWGSGAGELSKKLSGNIANFDIGGGTTNVAVFQNGEVVDTFAADIGGRLVKINSDGIITYVSEKIKFLVESLGLENIRVGQKVNTGEFRVLAACMADMFSQLIGEQTISDNTRRLFIDHPNSGLKIDRVMFSGGVAEYIYREENSNIEESLYRFGDVGPLLGSSIRRILPEMSAGLLNPLEKIRATVVGAGSYSTSISGSTIAVNEKILPMKSIPVIKVSCLESNEGILSKKIVSQLKLYGGDQVAVAIFGIEDPGYLKLKNIAREILSGLAGTLNSIIVITECDCAKALGLLLRTAMNNLRPVVCLDKIHVEDGDFIDIGKPICGVVPVIVKTLIFSS